MTRFDESEAYRMVAAYRKLADKWGSLSRTVALYNDPNDYRTAGYVHQLEAVTEQMHRAHAAIQALQEILS